MKITVGKQDAGRIDNGKVIVNDSSGTRVDGKRVDPPKGGKK